MNTHVTIPRSVESKAFSLQGLNRCLLLHGYYWCLLECASGNSNSKEGNFSAKAGFRNQMGGIGEDEINHCAVFLGGCSGSKTLRTCAGTRLGGRVEGWLGLVLFLTHKSKLEETH